MRLIKIAIIIVASIVILSCATRPIAVSDGLTPMELIQRGQEASDRNRYAHALQFYDALIERYPFDIDFICAAEYEIAFIHYKQKDYDLSRAKFNALLARYYAPGGQMLPQQFEILSNMVLARIDEIEAQKSMPLFRRR